MTMNPTTFPDEVEPDEMVPETFAAEVEPDAPAVAAPSMDSRSLVDVLGADIPLPTLIKFCPNDELREAADLAAAKALMVKVSGPEGLLQADAALTDLTDCLNAIEAHFEEPARILFNAHRRVTGIRGEWMKVGQDAKTSVSRLVVDEQRRLEREAAEARRREQEEADRKAKEDARREAEEAARQQAPAAVVEELARKAETVTAPPVAHTPAAPRLAGTTVVKAWKCRLKGTPGDLEPNPKMAEVTPAQAAQVRALMQDVIDGKAPLTAFELNWPVLNARAKADKGTFAMAGLEAFEDGVLRSKGRR